MVGGWRPWGGAFSSEATGLVTAGSLGLSENPACNAPRSWCALREVRKSVK